MPQEVLQLELPLPGQLDSHFLMQALQLVGYLGNGVLFFVVRKGKVDEANRDGALVKQVEVLCFIRLLRFLDVVVYEGA